MPKDILLKLPVIDAFINFYCVYKIEHNPETLHAFLLTFICYTENEKMAIEIMQSLKKHEIKNCVDYFVEPVKDKIL